MSDDESQSTESKAILALAHKITGLLRSESPDVNLGLNALLSVICGSVGAIASDAASRLETTEEQIHEIVTTYDHLMNQLNNGLQGSKAVTISAVCGMEVRATQIIEDDALSMAIFPGEELKEVLEERGLSEDAVLDAVLEALRRKRDKTTH